MQSCRHTESQFLIPTHHSDWHDVAGSDEERGVKHIFWLSYFLPAYLQQNIAGFDSRTRRRGVLHDLRHFRERTFYRLTRHGYMDANPAMPGFAKTHEIAPNFLGCFNRHSVTRRVVLKAADNNTNHLTFHVQERRASFPTLRRQIKTHVSRRKITAQIFSIKSRHHSKIGRLRQIQRKT